MFEQIHYTPCKNPFYEKFKRAPIIWYRQVLGHGQWPLIPNGLNVYFFNNWCLVFIGHGVQFLVDEYRKQSYKDPSTLARVQAMSMLKRLVPTWYLARISFKKTSGFEVLFLFLKLAEYGNNNSIKKLNKQRYLEKYVWEANTLTSLTSCYPV